MKNYRLTEGALRYALSLITEKGLLMALEASNKYTAEDIGHMKEAGMVDDQNRFQKEANEILGVISAPTVVQQWGMINTETVYEQTVYYKKGTEFLVGLRHDGTFWHIEAPFDPESDYEGISQYTGTSMRLSSDVDLTLDYDAARVLAMILDLIRMNQAGRIFTDGTVETVTVDELKAFAETNKGPQTVSFYLESHLFEDGSVQAVADLEGTLDRMRASGSVSGSDVITVSDGIFLLAQKLLSVKNVVTCNTATDAAGSVTYNKMLVLQDGVNDLLMLDFGSDSVTFMTVSAAGLLMMLTEFTDDPSAYAEGMVSAASEVVTPQEVSQVKQKTTAQPAPGQMKFCTKCGTPIIEGGKFCAGCGEGVN